MKNWKTSLAGISAGLLALGKAIGEYASGGFAAIDFSTLSVGLTAAAGLLFAKDHNVTGK
jgi:hypothetical protein